MSVVISSSDRNKKMKNKRRIKKKTSSSSSSSSSVITIKPFRKPPALPTNFYEISKRKLLESMDGILHQTTTSSTHPNNPSTTNTSSSREELYQMVQDLCNHSYGPNLYREVIQVIYAAALTSLQRLTSSTNSSTHTSNSNMNGDIQCHWNEMSKCVHVTSRNGFDPASSHSKSQFLQSVWDMWETYMNYLSCIQSICLYLDRLYVYLPSSSSSMENGRIVPRSDDSTLSIMENNHGYWSLWEVGVYSLFSHLSCKQQQQQSQLNCQEDVIMGDDSTNHLQQPQQQQQPQPITVLQAFQKTVVSQLLEELTDYNSLLMEQSQQQQQQSQQSQHKHSIPAASTFHKALLRNCVSMLRTLGSTTMAMDTMDNVTGQFLQTVESAMTHYFQQECQQKKFLQDNNAYNARDVLRHIDARLKQVHSMTFYYLLAGPTTTTTTTTTADPTKRHNHPNHMNNNNNKILTHVVETHLLTPHFTTEYLLNPAHLYPILDNGCQILHDVRRFYIMSKRVNNTINNNNNITTHRPDNHNNTSTTTAVESNNTVQVLLSGTDKLRNAFGEYGKERGLHMVQFRHNNNNNNTHRNNHHTNNTTSSKTQIVSDLLSLKKNLEMLHIKAFAADATFAKTIRGIFEVVVNAGAHPAESDDNNNNNTNSAKGTRQRRIKNHLAQHGDGGKLVAELLAKFVDLRLKSSKTTASAIANHNNNNYNNIDNNNPLWSYSTSNNDMEEFQSEVMDLFRHVHSKDVFEAFYKQDLAKRLLSNKSASSDAEKAFISRLKAECGSVYTSKMEGMFKDMDLSGEVMSTYAAHLRKKDDDPPQNNNNNNNNTADMDVQVLTTGYWPVYPQHPNLILPTSLVNGKQNFDEYYKSKYQGRRIAWQHSLGNCIVKAKFPKYNTHKDLVINLLQAVVLLCFNDDGVDGKGYSISDVMFKTGLQDRDEASRVLLSLSVGKDGTRVLTKIDHVDNAAAAAAAATNEDETNDDANQKKTKRRFKMVHDKDIFLFNKNFTSSAHRIRITNIQMKERPEDRKKTHDAVSRDRLYLIDAAIVRTMKARKTLDHNSLISEVLNQVRFATTGTDIKMRIEGLIDREYMARSEEDRSKYNYVA